MKTTMSSTSLLVSAAAAFFVVAQIGIASFFTAVDPGVRPSGSIPSAGGVISGLSPNQSEYFVAGQADFAEEETVAEGMGPRMNLDSCGGCHSQPAIGGSSPIGEPADRLRERGRRDRHRTVLPLGERAGAGGALRRRTPTVRADGGVHALFTITGRVGATGCTLDAARLRDAGRQPQRDLPDSDAGVRRRPDRSRFRTAAILASQASNASAKADARDSRPRELRRRRAGPSPARPTTTATTAPSPGSGGRRRTSR